MKRSLIWSVRGWETPPTSRGGRALLNACWLGASASAASLCWPAQLRSEKRPMSRGSSGLWDGRSASEKDGDMLSRRRSELRGRPKRLDCSQQRRLCQGRYGGVALRSKRRLVLIRAVRRGRLEAIGARACAVMLTVPQTTRRQVRASQQWRAASRDPQHEQHAGELPAHEQKDCTRLEADCGVSRG